MNASTMPKKLKWLFIIFTLIMLASLVFVLLRISKTEEEPRPKIGFIILGDINIPGWNYAHYHGIKDASKRLDVDLVVRDKVEENTGRCPQAIGDLAREGCGMIFLASFGYPVEVKDVVSLFPHIAFPTYSPEVQRPNMTSYFVRMYQGRYLAGALAGMKTKSNVIGYVAAMGNSEVMRGINAFTLGVHKTNPDAKVVVIWTGSWQDEEKEAKNAERLIKEAGADVLTYHQDEAAVANAAEKLGVDYIGYNEKLKSSSVHNLASVICHWEVYYYDVIKRYLKGEINATNNHWIGIQRGTVELVGYSPAVTEDMHIQLNSLRMGLMNDGFIFSGEIYDNKGNLRCKKGEVISDDTLLKDIDWLVKGVEVLE